MNNTTQFTAKDMATAIALNSFFNGFKTKEGIKSADISTLPNQDGLSKITVTLESGEQFVIEVHAI
jgi:hypothetical protein